MWAGWRVSLHATLGRSAADCSGSAVGWGSGRWLGRWQASHRNGVPDGARTRSEQGGPTVPPQRPESPLIRSKCPVSGVPLLGTQGGMVVVVRRGDAWDFMRTKESSQLTEHSPSWGHTRREHTSERSKGPYAAVHTAALVAIATTRKKPQWPSTDGGSKKMWHRCPTE